MGQGPTRQRPGDGLATLGGPSREPPPGRLGRGEGVWRIREKTPCHTTERRDPKKRRIKSTRKECLIALTHARYGYRSKGVR